MECSEKPIWERFKAEEPDENARQLVRDHWDRVAKPLDGLGKFEDVITKIGAIAGTEHVSISKRAVIMMCADNGIVEEGISQSGQEVTTAVAMKMGVKQSSVGKMASVISMDTIPVDIGINREETIPGVRDLKVRQGTRNFLKEPAMTAEETTAAILIGINLVRECKEQGYELLATGEMGIGNTTTSSALTAALLGCSAKEVTGRGAGLDDMKLQKKIHVIETALEKYGFDGADSGETCRDTVSTCRNPEYAFCALQTVGGLDIAGLAGICIGGAIYRVPIVLDGVISLAAALAAERMVPGTRDYLIASHAGKEPAVRKLMDELGLDAVIEARLALGEGTGAVMMAGLLDMALSVYNSQTTFTDMNIDQYERYQKR